MTEESDADTFAERLKGRIVPEHVQAKVDDELKAAGTEPSSANMMTRNYLDWVTSVPWGAERLPRY